MRVPNAAFCVFICGLSGWSDLGGLDMHSFNRHRLILPIRINRF